MQNHLKQTVSKWAAQYHSNAMKLHDERLMKALNDLLVLYVLPNYLVQFVHLTNGQARRVHRAS